MEMSTSQERPEFDPRQPIRYVPSEKPRSDSSKVEVDSSLMADANLIERGPQIRVAVDAQIKLLQEGLVTAQGNLDRVERSGGTGVTLHSVSAADVGANAAASVERHQASVKDAALDLNAATYLRQEFSSLGNDPIKTRGHIKSQKEAIAGYAAEMRRVGNDAQAADFERMCDVRDRAIAALEAAIASSGA